MRNHTKQQRSFLWDHYKYQLRPVPYWCSCRSSILYGPHDLRVPYTSVLECKGGYFSLYLCKQYTILPLKHRTKTSRHFIFISVKTKASTWLRIEKRCYLLICVSFWCHRCKKNNLSYLTIISSQNGSLLSINCQKHVVCCMLVCYGMDTFFYQSSSFCTFKQYMGHRRSCCRLLETIQRVLLL